MHHPFLQSWPPGYLAALQRWDRLPWRIRQLLAVADHGALEPGLRVWRSELGFELALLSRQTYTEVEFRELARAAVGSIAFLRGLIWRADPEVAQTTEWEALERLLATRAVANQVSPQPGSHSK